MYRFFHPASWLVLAACAGGLCSPAGASPQLLNLDFGQGSGGGKRGPAAFGLDEGDAWNLVHEPGSPRIRRSGLVWSDGSSSPAELLLENAPGVWSNSSADPMMSTFVYAEPNALPTPVLTLSNLEPGSYDVFLYGHGADGANDQNTGFTLEVGDRVVGSQSTTTDGSWVSSTWKEGAQYVVFRSVPIGSAGEPLVVRLTPGVSGYTPLNGMQLVRRCVSSSVRNPPLRKRLGEVVRFATPSFPDGTYQWRFGTNVVTGATTNEYSFEAASSAQAGAYRCDIARPDCTLTYEFELEIGTVAVSLVPLLWIDAPVGARMEIQYLEETLSPPAWRALTQLTITNRPHLFLDLAFTNTPVRLYRAVSPGDPPAVKPFEPLPPGP